MNAQLDTRDAPVSLGDWLLTLIIFCIPIVGLVMLFVWAFSSGTNRSKQNFCRATLLLYVIVLVLIILIGIMGGFAILHGAHALGGGALL